MKIQLSHKSPPLICRNIYYWLTHRFRPRKYAVLYLLHNIPQTMVAGTNHCYGLLLKNCGNITWQDITADGGKINLAIYINNKLHTTVLLDRLLGKPGKYITVFFSFEVPNTTQPIQLKFDLVHQNVTTFEQAGCPPLLLECFVTRSSLKGSLLERVRITVFNFLFDSLPLNILNLKWKFYAVAYKAADKYYRIKRHSLLTSWKRVNEQLATKEELLRKTTMCSLPQRLILDTTSRCNLSCINCFRQAFDFNFNKFSDIDEHILEKIINDLFPTLKFINITLSGEPFLSPHLSRMVKASEHYGVKFSITTNGMLLPSEKLLKRLLPNTAYWEISLDSLVQETLAHLRPGADFTIIQKNMQQVIRMRNAMENVSFNIGISMTLYSVNMHELPDIIKWIAQAGGDFVRTVFGVIYVKSMDSLSPATRTDYFNQIRKQALAVAAEHKIRLSIPPDIQKRIPLADSPLTSSNVCEFLYQVMRIDQFGNMLSCLFRPSLYTETLSADTDLHSKWNCSALRNLRDRYGSTSAPEQCQNCFIIHEPGQVSSQLTENFYFVERIQKSVYPSPN